MSLAIGCGLALGYAADALVGDPRRFHPVAGFGTLAARLERVTYRDRRDVGVAYVALLVGGTAGLGVGLARVVGRSAVGTVLGTAVATWAVLGGRAPRPGGAPHAQQMGPGA